MTGSEMILTKNPSSSVEAWAACSAACLCACVFPLVLAAVASFLHLASI